MKTLLFTAIVAAVGIAGAAVAKEPCLQRDMIDGWGARDSHTLVVSDRFRKKYLLTVNGWCQDIDFSLGISFHGHGNSMSCLARGDRIVPHGGGVVRSPGARCIITKIEYYTPEMEAAYKKAKEAKKAAKDAPPKP